MIQLIAVNVPKYLNCPAVGAYHPDYYFIKFKNKSATGKPHSRAGNAMTICNEAVFYLMIAIFSPTISRAGVLLK